MRHLPKIVLLYLLCSNIYNGDAQEVRWQVKDNFGYVISQADVIVRNAQSELLAFDNTDSTGTARFRTDAWPDSIMVEINKSGYASLKLLLSKRETQRIFILKKNNAEKLQEVVLYFSPVKKEGDTLLFNAQSFRSATDRNAEDLLKKIPGITIDSDGRIAYMGKAISHLYVEGLDLTGERYTGITRNLGSDDIERVELYQRHQPIRVLQKVKQTDQIALNLILKNHFKRIFPVRTGYVPFTPYYDAALKPMMLGAGRQYLFQLRSSNRGFFEKDHLLTINAEYLKNGFEDYFSRKDLIHSGFQDEYKFYEKLFNFKINRSTELGGDFSYLVVDGDNPNKQWRINGIYNLQQPIFEDKTIIRPAGDSVYFIKQSKRYKTNRDLSFKILRTINNDKFYFQSDLELKYPSLTNLQTIRYNDYHVTDRVNLPYGVIGNKTHIISPLSSGLLESITDVVYNYSHQSLFMPSVSFSSPYFSAGDTIEQQAFYAIRSFQQSLEFMKSPAFEEGFRYPMIVYRFTDAFITTQAYRNTMLLGGHFHNKIGIRQHSLRIITGWRKSFDKWLFSLQIPLTYRFWERKNLLNNRKIRLDRPGVSFRAMGRRVGIYSRILLSYFIGESYRDFPAYFPGYRFVDFNRVERGNLIFFKTERQNINMTYDYDWAARALSFRAKTGVAWGADNYKVSTRIDTMGLYDMSFKAGHYYFQNYHWSMYMGKYFMDARISIDINTEGLYQKSQVWVNEKLSGMQLNVFRTSLFFRGHSNQWQYSLNPAYTKIVRFFNNTKNDINGQFSFEGNLSHSIGEFMTLNAGVYSLGFRTNRTNWKSLFSFHLRAEFKWKKNGMFFIQAENLNNVKKITEISYNSYQTFTKNISVRPMEILFGLQYTF